MSKNLTISFLIAVLVWLSACESIEKPVKPTFELLSASETGVDFANRLTQSPDFNILEYLYFYNGGGVAAGDINNDGLIDLYFTSNQESNKLYLNKGNLKFEDITESAGVQGTGTWSTGVTMTDVNADGLLDIYVCQVGDYKEAKGRNELFINQGDGTFKESAQEWGLDFVGFSTQSAFFDYDGDGDLDMYLLNHSVKNPAAFSEAVDRSKADPSGDKLFESQLAQGESKFVDVTSESGIYSSNLGFGLGLAISDVNKDGWPDIYISNDFTENDYLYLNNADGTFREELNRRIQHTSRYSMGNDIADLNNDGWVDILTTDMLPSDPEIWRRSLGEDKLEVYKVKLSYGYDHQYVRNTMQINLGNGQFSDLSLYANNFATDWSWAPLVFDMDNDGLQDIHISNGIYKRPNDLDFINYTTSNTEASNQTESIQQQQIASLPTLKIPNYAGRNHGQNRFENMAETMGLNQPSYSNGSAYADLDNDGDLELILNNTEQEAFIYENRQDSTHSYLKIRFSGPELNPFGLGAEVSIDAAGNRQMRENFNTRGFQSAVAPELHFGLGSTEMIDELKVIWPDGKEQRLQNVSANQLLTLDYNQAENGNATKKTESSSIDSPITNITYKHREDEFTDFDREYLIPRRYNTEGPALAVGDVNGDGLDDIYLGGAKEQAGELWIQQADGTFNQKINPLFTQLARAEDTDAVFFDADGDNDLDLYVVSGGNEFGDTQIFSYDRLFLNNGSGDFQFSPGALNRIGGQGKTISIADVDGDGDNDAFIGVNVVSGSYGSNPNHFLLINDGRGFFANEIRNRIADSGNLGMINDALWFDFDGDQDQDLVLVGEWTAIQLYENDGGGQFTKVESAVLDAAKGWWYSLEIADINNDGRQDIIAGNLGLNSKLKTSPEEPLKLYLNDYDQNGQTDPIMFHYQEGTETPFATRDDLIKQVSAFKKLHPNYSTYAKITGASELLGEKMNAALTKSATDFQSAVFLNLESGFEMVALPIQAQMSTVAAIVTDDFDADGNTDLMLFGNNYSYRNDIGRSDAKPITFLLGKGDGTFELGEEMSQAETWGEYRQASTISLKGNRHIVAVRNNDQAVFLKK